jgi:hypothetical protein
MTRPALDGNRLEVQKPVVVWRHRQVAPPAGHLPVVAPQRKPAVPVMIEALGEPVGGHVAGIAGHALVVGGKPGPELSWWHVPQMVDVPTNGIEARFPEAGLWQALQATCE